MSDRTARLLLCLYNKVLEPEYPLCNMEGKPTALLVLFGLVLLAEWTRAQDSLQRKTWTTEECNGKCSMAREDDENEICATNGKEGGRNGGEMRTFDTRCVMNFANCVRGPTREGFRFLHFGRCRPNRPRPTPDQEEDRLVHCLRNQNMCGCHNRNEKVCGMLPYDDDIVMFQNMCQLECTNNCFPDFSSNRVGYAVVDCNRRPSHNHDHDHHHHHDHDHY